MNRNSLQTLTLWLLVAWLALLPAVTGMMWPWQGLLTGLVGALILVIFAAGLLLPAPVASEPPPARTGKPRPRNKATDTEPNRATEVAASPESLRLDLLDGLLILFILWQGLSLVTSVYKFVSLVYLIKVLAYGGLFWLIRYGVRTPLWQKRVGMAILGGGALASIWGLREYVRTVRQLGQTEWRIFGPMFNPNVLAGYLLLCLFVAVALLWVRRGLEAGPEGQTDEDQPRTTEIVTFFAMVLMLAGLLLTGSKAALGALLVGILVLATLAAGRGRQAVWVRLGSLVLVLLVIGAALSLAPIRVRLLNAFGWQSNSSIFRALTWQGTVRMVAASPWVGFGGGAFENAYPRYTIAGFTRAAHQSYLQLAAECGLPALVLGLAWGIALLGYLYRGARNAPLLGLRVACAACYTALLVSALQEFVDYPWYIPAVGATFFAVAGLGASLADGVGGVRRGVGPMVALPLSQRSRAVVLLAVCLLTMLGTGLLLRAEALGNRADRLAADGSYPMALDSYQSAAASNPWQARFHVQASRLLESLSRETDRPLLQKALDERLASIRLQPTEPVNYLSAARLYDMAGDEKSALRSAEEALKLYPNYPRGLVHLARLQERMGRLDASRATYRRLLEVYHSPVGQHPPVTEQVETAYAYAWVAQGEEAQRLGYAQEAFDSYGKAAALLAKAISLDREFLAQMTQSNDTMTGRLRENEALAKPVAVMLTPAHNALAVMRLAQLRLAMGENELGEAALQRLANGDSEGARVEDLAARAWGTLRLARKASDDKRGDAAKLASLGLQVGQKALAELAKKPYDRELWGPGDVQELQQLLDWARSAALATSPTAKP